MDSAVNYYNHYVYDRADRQVIKLFLMESPWPILGICAVYWLFVKKIGIKVMDNRKPIRVEGFMILYNAAQSLINAYVAVYGTYLTMSDQFSFMCQEVITKYDTFGIDSIHISHLYLLIKVLDLMDTIFMVMRKNFHQITFLHVYHHILMVFGGWLTLRYLPGGQIAVLGIMNSIVHTVMYFYYLLAAKYPEYKKNIWWKKHLTQLQLFQFCAIFVHHNVALFNPKCKYPKLPLVIFDIQNTVIMVLFINFYYNAYIKVKKPVENGPQSVKKQS